MPYSGDERRMGQDEQLGYIRGKVESIQEDLSEFKVEVKDDIIRHTLVEDKRMEALERVVASNTKTLTAIERSIDAQTNTGKYIWITIKSVAGAIFLALTVKLGDILTLLK